MRVGLIRVMTLSSQSALQSHGRLIQERFPALTVESMCIENQYEGIHDEASEKQAIPKIVDLGESLARQFDVLFVSCAADPGVNTLRKTVGIPVVGAGQSLAAVSGSSGRRVGVLTITDELPKAVEDGLGRALHAWRHVPCVRTAKDLQLSEALQHLVETAKQLKQEGCDVIALACTGFSSIRAARSISYATKMSVVDPVVAGGSVIATLAFSAARNG